MDPLHPTTDSPSDEIETDGSSGSVDLPQTTRSGRPRKRPGRKPRSPEPDFKYRTIPGEEMTEAEIDALAMRVASFLADRLRLSAIREMKKAFPDSNPLNEA